MKALHLLFISFLILIVGACFDTDSSRNMSMNDCPQVATREKAGNDEVVVLHLNQLKDTLNIPLSQLIEDFEIIPLDSKNEALVGASTADITDHYIGVFSRNAMPYKLFDRKGNFLCEIGSIGQGPNEYNSLYHSQIDDKNNRIYLLPWNAKQLLVYDLEGNDLPPIPLPDLMPKGAFHVDTEAGILTAGLLPFSNTKNIIWQQDFKGEVLREVNAKPYYSGYDDYSNEINHSQNTGIFDFSIFHWGEQEDSLYHYNAEQNRLVPVFTIGFGTSDIIKQSYGEIPGYYIASITDQVVNGAGLPPVNILVDKQTLKGCYFNLINDFLGNMKLYAPLQFFNNGRFVHNTDPGNLKEYLEIVLANPEKLKEGDIEKYTKLINSISDNDNNYVLTGKLKAVAGEIKQTIKSVPALTVKQPHTTVKQEAPQDTAHSEIPDYTAYLSNWKKYFKTNNKFKDWDPNDPKRVMVIADIDKYGKQHNVRIHKSCGNKELDDEAIRLIQEAKIEPASNKNGENVENKNWMIPVNFPAVK